MTDSTPKKTSGPRLPGLPAGEVADDDPAWWADMTAWTDARLAERGIRRVGPLAPVRVWARSAVSRFETDRGRMWAKAVPGIFAHEIALTELIADIDPAPPHRWSLPTSGLGRILTDHVEGPLLTDAPEPLAWTATLARMAELQRVLAADVQGTGARRRRSCPSPWAGRARSRVAPRRSPPRARTSIGSVCRRGSRAASA